MSFDSHANLAISTVATPPSPANSGTSLTVAAGQGAFFPTPPFNVTVWPANTVPNPDNSEIVRVAGISTDTFTITRATDTEPTPIGPIAITAGMQIANSVSAKVLIDIQNATSGGGGQTVAESAAYTAVSGDTILANGTPRTVTDAVTTNDSPTLTSATADFTSADVGRTIYDGTLQTVLIGTTIQDLVNSMTVTMSANAAADATNLTLGFGGLRITLPDPTFGATVRVQRQDQEFDTNRGTNPYSADVVASSGLIGDQSLVRMWDQGDYVDLIGDGTNWQLLGSRLTNRTEYRTLPTSTAGAAANFPFTYNPEVQATGDQLLDLTDPLNPTIIAAGRYAITAALGSELGSSGEQITAYLATDANDFGWETQASAPLDAPDADSGIGSGVQVSMSNYLEAGALIIVVVAHNAPDPIDIAMIVSMQRLD